MKFLGHESQAPAAAISAAMRGLAAPNRDAPRSADGTESFPDVLAALAGDVAPVAPQRPGAVGDAPPGVGITPSGGGDRPVQTGRPWAAPPPAAGSSADMPGPGHAQVAAPPGGAAPADGPVSGAAAPLSAGALSVARPRAQNSLAIPGSAPPSPAARQSFDGARATGIAPDAMQAGRMPGAGPSPEGRPAGAHPVMRMPAASDLSAPAPATPRGVAPEADGRAKAGTVPGVAPADGRNAVAITGQPRPGAVPTPGMMSGATGHGMLRPVAAATPDPMPGNSRETGGSARLPDGVGSAALQPGQRPDMGVMRGVTAHGQARADGHAAGAAAPPAAGTHDAAVSQLAVRDAAMPDMPRDRGALTTNRDVTWPVSRQTGQPPDITRGSPRDAMMPGQVAGSAISPGRADGAVETPPRGAAVPDGPSQPDRMFRAPASAPTAPTPSAAVIATPTGASHLAAPDGSFARPGEGIDRRVGGESALAEAGRLQADPVGTARAGAEPATSARDLPRQMAVQISELLHGHKHAQKADRQIDILLDPRELGRVKIALSGGESSVSVNIAADRPETLELLKRHVGSLAAEFSDLGYEQASFTFGGDGFAGTQDDPPGKTSVAGPGPDATGPDTGRPAVLANDDRVDIRL